MTDLDLTLRSIEGFLAGCRDAALIEPGQEPVPLAAGHWNAAMSGGRLRLEAWDETRTLTRRVRGILRQRPGQLELEVERFGKKTGSLLLVDRARPASLPPERRAARMMLRERFRRFLTRQFAGWTLDDVSTETDLEHSLSPAYPRAMVKRGGAAWAAVAADGDAVAAGHALTFGLIWLDHLRRRERRLLVEGLCLFLPRGAELATCLRIRWLNRNAARFVVFLYDRDWEEEVDPVRHGNLDTRLEAPGSTPPARRASHRATGQPEALLESIVRTNPSLFDPELLVEPVYGQVPAVAGADRGLIDLLAVSGAGRLAVLELKASEDIHLPLQALDYWLRVHWHHERGEFAARGFFPGVALLPRPPRLLLIAPALQFHPTTEAILRYFSPDVEVERVGLALQWERDLRVMFRLRGAQGPA